MSQSHLDEIRAQFTRQADAYAEMDQTRDQRALDALVSIAGTQPSDRILDVACGPGFLTMSFAACAAQAVGLDATPNWIARASAEAQRRGLANVRFESGDAEALPFPDARFDLVACRAAFHHFPQPARVLAEMARVAAPGGRLLIADMLGSETATKASLHDRIERLCDPTHVRAIPASEFATLFGDAGLEVARNIPTTTEYDLAEWMAHGGPSDADARAITALFDASVAGDDSDLAARRVDGKLRFRHRVAIFVLRVPAR